MNVHAMCARRLTLASRRGRRYDAAWDSGTTVNIVGDISKLTPEQKEKLKAMGIDVDALGGPQG